MDPQTSQLEMITIQTSAPTPFPAVTERKPWRTERLLMRPHELSHLQAHHEMRLQPDVMCWTIQGKPDADLAESEANLKRFLSPAGDVNLNFAIFDAETEQMIGVGGNHLQSSRMGWPEMGYMFRKEAWGKGYATEFVKGFLEYWWAFPRTTVDKLIERELIETDGETGSTKECLLAITESTNEGSQKVLKKTGWKHIKTWQEPDVVNPANTVTLFGWIATKPSSDGTVADGTVACDS